MRRGLVVVFALLLLLRALEVRLPEMTRPLWEDEVHHNEPILSTHDIAELEQNKMFKAQFQPLLDFWLRQSFWFRHFAPSERTMRLPAMIYSLAMVLCAYVLALLWFARRMDLAWAALLAFLVGLWLVDNPTQIHYSAEARHYSLIALLSTLWCGLLVLFDGRPRLLFAATTLLFANSHFFALPLIGGAYAYRLPIHIYRRDWWSIAFDLLVAWGVYYSATHVNAVELQLLLQTPPSALPAAVSPFSDAVLHAGFVLWRQFADFLAVPPATWLAWLVLFAGAALRRDRRWILLFLAVTVGMPLFCVYVKARSSYPFGARYFSAFFGLGLVTVVGVLDVAVAGTRWLAPRLSPRARLAAAMAAAAALALAFQVPRFTLRLFADGRAVHGVPPNFSPYYRAYAEATAEDKPLFVLHNHCFGNDIPNLYLLHLVPNPNDRQRQDADALGCETHIDYIQSVLQGFLDRYGSQGGFVLLDQKESDCRARPVPPIAFAGRVEKVRSTSVCAWKVYGARTLQDLGKVASAVGFVHSQALF